MEDSKNYNPIRKVLGMLKDMQDELTREQESEKDLFEKAMCACSTSEDELSKIITHSDSEISRLTAKVAADTAQKTKLEAELKAHNADKAKTESGIAQATSLRGKEHASFVESEKMLSFSLSQLDAAIPMIENSGSAAAFLQAYNKRSQDAASNLRRIVSVTQYLSAESKDTVLGFLQNTENSMGVSAGSQQIIGVLKAMRDEMAKDLKNMQKEEADALAAFNEMKASLVEHLGIVVKTIAEKEKLVGALTLSISQDSDALEDAQTELADATKYLSQLKETCAQKEKDRDLRAKTRSEEIAAISEAMEILSSDEAMETMSKHLKQPGLVQKESNYGAFLQAKAVLKKALSHSKKQPLVLMQVKRPPGDLPGGKHASKATKVVGFMIDNMVEVLHDEDVNDEHKKDYCANETASFTQLLADKEAHHEAVEKQIAVLESEIEQLIADIKALEEQINWLDQQVLAAGVQRKKEHDEFYVSYQGMDVAQQLIDKAANRLQQFYNPSMFAGIQPAKPQTEGFTQTAYFMGPDKQSAPALTQENAEEPAAEANEANFGAAAASFIQLRSAVAPPEIPDTPKTYEKKESGGVIGLMNQMKTELSTDKKEAEVEEKHAQKDYARTMQEAKVSREAAVKAKIDKEATKASKEEKLVMAKTDLERTAEEIFQIKQYLTKLHIECDFLMRNFETRHESRIDEEVGLETAETIATHGDPPSYPGTEKMYEEEHSKKQVD
jgi:septal ring factor EnvC (AmiA/AmiB activator)